MTLPKRVGDFLMARGFHAVCYLGAAYFFVAYCLLAGVPPSKPLDSASGSCLGLALFLFLLPEAKKLKLGHVFEFEARVKEIREDVKQFKEDTRGALAIYTSAVAAISNSVSQQVNVTLPGQADATRANEDLETALTKKPERSSLEEDIRRFVDSEGNDLNYALAKLRMQLERELRRILGKRTDSSDVIDQGVTYLSARTLFVQFVRTYQQYGGMRGSFDYVLQICNAAIHGQYIPETSAHEALSMGIRMLAELREIHT